MGVVDSGITATVNAHRIVLQGPLWRLQAVFFLLFLFKAGSVSHSNFLNPLSSFSLSALPSRRAAAAFVVSKAQLSTGLGPEVTTHKCGKSNFFLSLGNP